MVNTVLRVDLNDWILSRKKGIFFFITDKSSWHSELDLLSWAFKNSVLVFCSEFLYSWILSWVFKNTVPWALWSRSVACINLTAQLHLSQVKVRQLLKGSVILTDELMLICVKVDILEMPWSLSWWINSKVIYRSVLPFLNLLPTAPPSYPVIRIYTMSI